MGIITGFLRKDTSNYCGCYSCRLACVRSHVGLLKKIPRVTYSEIQKSQMPEGIMRR